MMRIIRLWPRISQLNLAKITYFRLCVKRPIVRGINCHVPWVGQILGRRRRTAGWTILCGLVGCSVLRACPKFVFEQWRADHTTSALLARISPAGEIRRDEEVKGTPDVRIIALCPPGDDVLGGANQPPVDS